MDGTRRGLAKLLHPAGAGRITSYNVCYTKLLRNYGEAIVAADEVLQRDPADRVAKSVRAVSGLRVATESIADLRNDEDMKGSARADAVSLAKVMRETLGEDVLVPPVDEEAEALERQKAQARRYRRRKPVVAAEKPTEATQPAGPKVNGDPFSVLR